MSFVAIQPLSRAAIVANENISLLFLVSGINRHVEIYSESYRRPDVSWPDFNRSIAAVPGPPHDMNRENAALVAGQEVVDEIANDRIGLVAQLGYDPANQGAAAAVPFQVDRAVKIPGAVNFRPTMRPSRLFRPNFFEFEFPLQLRIPHDLAAQRSAPGRDHMNHGLHR